MLVITTYWSLQHIGCYNMLVITICRNAVDRFILVLLSIYWLLQHIGYQNILIVTTHWLSEHISVITAYRSLYHIGYFNMQERRGPLAPRLVDSILVDNILPIRTYYLLQHIGHCNILVIVICRNAVNHFLPDLLTACWS